MRGGLFYTEFRLEETALAKEREEGSEPIERDSEGGKFSISSTRLQ
jgi:hypothetical protein